MVGFGGNCAKNGCTAEHKDILFIPGQHYLTFQVSRVSFSSQARFILDRPGGVGVPVVDVTTEFRRDFFFNL